MKLIYTTPFFALTVRASAPIETAAIAYGSPLNSTAGPPVKGDFPPVSPEAASSVLANHRNIPTPVPDALFGSPAVKSYGDAAPTAATNIATATEHVTSILTSTTTATSTAVESVTKQETTTALTTITTIATTTATVLTTQSTTIHETTTCHETSTMSITDTVTIPGPTLTSAISAATDTAIPTTTSSAVGIPASAVIPASDTDNCTTSSSLTGVTATIIPATASIAARPAQSFSPFNTPIQPNIASFTWNSTSMFAPCMPTTFLRAASGAPVSGIASNCGPPAPFATGAAQPPGWLLTAPATAVPSKVANATCTTTLLCPPTFSACNSTVFSATSTITVDCGGCTSIEQTRLPLPDRPACAAAISTMTMIKNATVCAGSSTNTTPTKTDDPTDATVTPTTVQDHEDGGDEGDADGDDNE